MAEDEAPTSGQNLRAWRNAYGYSTREVAAKLEVVLGSRAVSHGSLSRYESGKQEIPLRIVEALGQLYGVPAGVLLMMPPPEKIAAKPA